MKKISCADMPGSDGACNHTVTGESTQECIDKMFAHAAESHSDKIASMTPEQSQQMGQFMTQFLDAQA
jgi:predicted small metal-binding protein